MGAANVKAVYEQWPDLPNTAFRALAYMALVSKDADQPPRYWGGREDLAAALGRNVPPENEEDEEVTRQRNAAFKAVRDATSLLSKRGAIAPVKQARSGQRQEWALNLKVRGNRAPGTEADPGEAHENCAPPPPEVDAQVHEDRAPEVHEKRADRCTISVDQAHENRAPKEDQETGGENKRISQSPQDLEGVRWLGGQGYGLTDNEALAVITEARRRAPRQIEHLVPYLESMMIDAEGNPKPDLALIVEAVQLGSASSPAPSLIESVKAPAAVAIDVPATPPGPRMTAQEAGDYMHANVCKTVACDRCARLRNTALKAAAGA